MATAIGKSVSRRLSDPVGYGIIVNIRVGHLVGVPAARSCCSQKQGRTSLAGGHDAEGRSTTVPVARCDPHAGTSATAYSLSGKQPQYEVLCSPSIYVGEPFK